MTLISPFSANKSNSEIIQQLPTLKELLALSSIACVILLFISFFSTVILHNV